MLIERTHQLEEREKPNKEYAQWKEECNTSSVVGRKGVLPNRSKGTQLRKGVDEVEREVVTEEKKPDCGS